MGVTVHNGNMNEPASLVSATFQHSYATCTLKFWHTVFGFGNSLNVSIYLNKERQIPIFRRDSNSQATSWSLASIHLGKDKKFSRVSLHCKFGQLFISIQNKGTLFTKFEIIFEASRTFSSFSYITIDDVSFENCAKPLTNSSTSCSTGEFKCNRGNCVPMDRICDSVDDCGDFSDEVLPICSSYQKYTIKKLLFICLFFIYILYYN